MPRKKALTADELFALIWTLEPDQQKHFWSKVLGNPRSPVSKLLDDLLKRFDSLEKQHLIEAETIYIQAIGNHPQQPGQPRPARPVSANIMARSPEELRNLRALVAQGEALGRESMKVKPRYQECNKAIADWLAEREAKGLGPDWEGCLEWLEKQNRKWVTKKDGKLITTEALMNRYREWKKRQSRNRESS